MFLDTAQQRDSVVSRAKELGYTPVSSVGAQAEVSLTISGVDSTVTQITIPKNAKFTTTFDDVTYTYVNPAAKNIAATSELVKIWISRTTKTWKNIVWIKTTMHPTV